jgi:hypothetical protein
MNVCSSTFQFFMKKHRTHTESVMPILHLRCLHTHTNTSFVVILFITNSLQKPLQWHDPHLIKTGLNSKSSPTDRSMHVHVKNRPLNNYFPLHVREMRYYLITTMAMVQAMTARDSSKLHTGLQSMYFCTVKSGRAWKWPQYPLTNSKILA